SCTSFFFRSEDGIRDLIVTGVQTCALPIWVLRKKADGLAALSKPAITSKNFRAAARWRYQAENNFQRGAFTGAIRPQQPVHLARDRKSVVRERVEISGDGESIYKKVTRMMK